jgi:hypothetical protein
VTGAGARVAGGLAAIAAVLGLVAAAAPSARATAPYVRKFPPLTTPWTRGVSPVRPLPEYPRPQLERSAWRNLNGQWQYERGRPGQKPPLGRNLAQTILVPFGVQSPLSGIERGDTAGWYRRTFTVPAGWRGRRVLLNFGAVTWAARVYVNGRLAGTHRGSYDSFSIDITRLLRRGANEIVVGYVNPIGADGEPIGKQIAGAPFGIHHTASSGIWQTVWLEPVSAEHLTGLDLTPDVAGGRLIVSAAVARVSPRSRLVAEALAGRSVVAKAAGPAGRPLSVPIAHAHLWSPTDPYLYGLRVRLLDGARLVDSVTSYFGMRSISLGRVDGVTRMLLNGTFVFQSGALDQGYWPDGVYSAPSDAALRFDILAAKRLGYNMLRKHVKVEPDRWYYWADRLGILVWQDMPDTPTFATHAPTASGRAEFRRELAAIVVQLRSHPSIVTWIPFNEGWGEFDPAGVTDEIKRLDPSRLVDTDSGSANCCAAPEPSASDVRDAHLYYGPYAVPPDNRASVIGEYGALLPYPPRAHRWPGVPLSIGSMSLSFPIPDVRGFLATQYDDLDQEMRVSGASAAVYTELAAYENELGIVSYDRKAYTIDPKLIRRLNGTLIADSQTPAGRRPPGPAIPPGQTGEWTFDEGRGTSAADASGGGHPLTLSGGASWTVGVHGAALSIAGPGQLATAAAPVVDTTHSFTVSAWLNSSAPGQSGTAVSQRGTDGSSFSLGLQTLPPGAQEHPGQVASGIAPPPLRTWWTFEVPRFGNCASLTCGVYASNHFDDGRFNPASGTWHYVTGVRDAQSHTVSVYVDGVPEDVEQSGALIPSRGPLTLGAGVLDYPGSDRFVGAIDDLRTFGRALSAEEASQLYQAERASPPAGDLAKRTGDPARAGAPQARRRRPAGRGGRPQEMLALASYVLYLR